MMETKLVLLGTGTPNACPNASGPSSAVVVGDRAYLVDFGPGVVRQAAKAYQQGIDAPVSYTHLPADIPFPLFLSLYHQFHISRLPESEFLRSLSAEAMPLCSPDALPAPAVSRSQSGSGASGAVSCPASFRENSRG